MKVRLLSLIILLLSVVYVAAEPFRFAQLTDIHLSRSNESPLQDLRRSIDEISATPDLAFVLVTGDVSEAGDLQSLLVAKGELDRLPIPYYVTSGNHETTWSESGCYDFARVFGSNRFAFTYGDVFFFGFNTGPVLKMSDGHISPQDITWAREQLASIPQGQKVIAVTHYPLQNGDVDNWFDLTDFLRRYNTQCIIGGHYHRNLLFSADGIPDVLNRSNLRGRDSINGYSIISVGPDSIRFAEKVVGAAPRQWLALPFEDVEYDAPDPDIRPDYSVNKQYPKVQEKWTASLGVGIYSAPTVSKGRVYTGDDEGNLYCLALRNGKTLWKRNFGYRVKGAPAVADGYVVFATADGHIYALNAKTGADYLDLNTDNGAVMGCPVISHINGHPVALIGGKAAFYAIDLTTRERLWTFTNMGGYCVSRPCIYDDKVYFGAWDCYFYALNLSDGSLVWKWSNGSKNDKYSPAAVWPVASHDKIFIVAPDRVLTCLNAQTGEVVYRTKQHQVRESIGISEDGETIISRCMNDSVLAIDASASSPLLRWKTSADYGYDHNPSMMIERGGVIVFGTKNGLLHGVDLLTGEVLWRHKMGNSVLNTVFPLSPREFVVSSTAGTVTRVRVKK